MISKNIITSFPGNCVFFFCSSIFFYFLFSLMSCSWVTANNLNKGAFSCQLLREIDAWNMINFMINNNLFCLFYFFFQDSFSRWNTGQFFCWYCGNNLFATTSYDVGNRLSQILEKFLVDACNYYCSATFQRLTTHEFPVYGCILFRLFSLLCCKKTVVFCRKNKKKKYGSKILRSLIYKNDALWKYGKQNKEFETK